MTNQAAWVLGSVSGLAMDFGRVTEAMLQPYEDTYWGLQLQRATNTSLSPPVQNFQGIAAYLLGMNYLKRTDDFDALNRQWHMISGLLNYSSGLGTLLPATSSTNMQIKLDVTFAPACLIGNESLRPDDAIFDNFLIENYQYLKIVQGSAEEHDTIEQMFPSQDAVSTVRLLQLAQQWATNETSSPILELVGNTVVAQGNTNHLGYGTTLLKNFDTNIWAWSTNIFTQPSGDYARVLITPGLVSNNTSTYSGMATLILSDEGYLAGFISGSGAPLHGAVSENVPNMANQATGPTFTYNLVDEQDSGPSFQNVTPNLQTVVSAFSRLDAASLSSGVNNFAFTPQENQLAVQIAIQNDMPTANNAASLSAGANNGSVGNAVGWPQTANQPVYDPVDPVSGEFYIDALDLSLPGPLPLQLRRNYLSQNLTGNQFGYGWKINFTPYLVLTTNTLSQPVIYAAEMDGVVLAYQQTNTGGPWVVLPRNNPSLNNRSRYGTGSEANLFNSILNINQGTNYTISAPDGSTRTYQINSFPVTSGTSVLERNRPYLVQWQDHAGNYSFFYYGTNSASNDFGQLNRISMANGNSLVFEYDFYGRIYEAFTQDGRFVLYDYDNYGDLITVTLPDDSQCQYQYQHYTFATNGILYTDSTHLMVQEIKPNGRIVTNAYDSLNRVTIQASTVGTNLVPVPNAFFFYTNNVTSPTNQIATGSTGVQNVFHNPTVYYYTSNLITGTVDPLGQTTTNVWFPDTPNGATGYYPRSLQYTVDKRGLTTQYYYDTNGNVTQMVALGNLTGEGFANQTATNTCTYTANNLPGIVTDQVGNGMQFVYDTTGPFKVIQAMRTSSGTAISTNLFSYTNVGASAFGLIASVTNAGAVTVFAYNTNGFKISQVQYPVTPDDPADTDPAVTHYFSYNLRGQMYQDQVAGGGLTQYDFDAMGRMTSRLVFDQNSNNLSSEYFYYNLNGELEWYAGPRSNPQNYIYYIYDGAGPGHSADQLAVARDDQRRGSRSPRWLHPVRNHLPNLRRFRQQNLDHRPERSGNDEWL